MTNDITEQVREEFVFKVGRLNSQLTEFVDMSLVDMIFYIRNELNLLDSMKGYLMSIADWKEFTNEKDLHEKAKKLKEALEKRKKKQEEAEVGEEKKQQDGNTEENKEEKAEEKKESKLKLLIASYKQKIKDKYHLYSSIVYSIYTTKFYNFQILMNALQEKKQESLAVRLKESRMTFFDDDYDAVLLSDLITAVNNAREDIEQLLKKIVSLKDALHFEYNLPSLKKMPFLQFYKSLEAIRSSPSDDKELIYLLKEIGSIDIALSDILSKLNGILKDTYDSFYDYAVLDFYKKSSILSRRLLSYGPAIEKYVSRFDSSLSYLASFEIKKVYSRFLMID